MIPGSTYIRDMFMACGVCALLFWSMAAGLLAFSIRQFALTIKHGPSLRPLDAIFPSSASVAAARGAKRLVHIYHPYVL